MENVWVDTRPAFHAGDSTGVLLVHGLAGTPAEMRPLEQTLASHTLFNLLLPGHGTPRAIESDRDDWLTAVSDGVAKLRETCDRIFIVGLSTGALLATVYAARYPVDGIVLLAPGLKISNAKFKWIGVAKYFAASIPEANRKNAGLTSATGWKSLWHFQSRSTEALDELRHLQYEARAAAPQVDCPTLIVQGLRDQTCEPDGANELQALIRNASLLLLERSGHCLTLDVEYDTLAVAVAEFIDP
jgi:carboxylesterase